MSRYLQTNHKDTGNTLLRQERLRHCWSQQDLADLLGATRNTVSRWERGQTIPGPYLRAKLCELFDREPQQLGWSPEDVEEQLPALSDLSEPVNSPVRKSFPLWSIPCPRNPFFTGREQLFPILHNLLEQQSSMPPLRSVALSGLAGIGKTQFALEYAYRYAHTYSAVFWIAAETAESMIASFLALADLLALPQRQERHHQQVVGAVNHWLSRQSNWLLIFDNVEDLALVKSFLPSTSNGGSLLFTSRRQSLDIAAHLLSLETMTPAESLQFFLHRARLQHPSEPDTLLESREIAAAQYIVEIMDGLPLAIDQAGAYLEAVRCSPSDYLKLLHTSPLLVLDERDLHTAHPFSVTRTFQLAFLQLTHILPEAIEVLTACALLAPEGIPEALFREPGTWSDTSLTLLASEPLRFHRAIKVLLSYSLLQRDPSTHTLIIHRLVQVILKTGLTEADRLLWQQRVLVAISKLFPSEEALGTDYWQLCERLLPHALVCLVEGGQGDQDTIEAWLLLTGHVAVYLSERFRYDEALPLLERALAIGEQLPGPEHPHLAFIFHGIADVWLRQGAYEQAEPLFLRAVALRERALGSEHPLLAIPMHRLAVLWWEQGRYEQARNMLERVLQLRVQALGPDHLLVSFVLGNLAGLLTEQGQYEQAEPLFLQAIAIRERILGSEHLEMAPPLQNLATLYVSLRHYRKAAILFQRVERIFVHAQMENHPGRAHLLYQWAEFCRLQGDDEQATIHAENALHIWERVLGPDHPDVAYALLLLADLARSQKQHEQAESRYQHVLYKREHLLGAEHPLLLPALLGLAHLSQDQLRLEEAESFYQRALRLAEQAHGPISLEVADTLHGLALLRHSQGQIKEEQSYYERVLAIRLQFLGPDHPRTQAIRSCLEALTHPIQQKEMLERQKSFIARADRRNAQASRATRSSLPEMPLREVTFTCAVCGETVTQQRSPGHTPRYCQENCKSAARKAQTRLRTQRWRAQKSDVKLLVNSQES